MLSDSRNNQAEENRMPPAGTGNASNPSPHNNDLEPQANQLIDKQGEKYLREIASIEDVPDAQDQQNMDDVIEEEKAE